MRTIQIISDSLGEVFTIHRMVAWGVYAFVIKTILTEMAGWEIALTTFLMGMIIVFIKLIQSRHEIEELKTHDNNVVALQNQIDVLREGQDTVTRQAEETKKLISQTSLAIGLKPRATQGRTQ